MSTVYIALNEPEPIREQIPRCLTMARGKLYYGTKLSPDRGTMSKKRSHTKRVSKKHRPAKAKHSCTNHATEKEVKKCEKGKIEPV